MEKQNVTLSLPKSLIEEAKTLASTTDRSLSELMRETLEERVRLETGYQKARDRQLSLMKHGIGLGTKGKTSYTRDELYERG